MENNKKALNKNISSILEDQTSDSKTLKKYLGVTTQNNEEKGFEYNLRHNADIVYLAMGVAKSKDPTALIKYFANIYNDKNYMFVKFPKIDQEVKKRNSFPEDPSYWVSQVDEENCLVLIRTTKEDDGSHPDFDDSWISVNMLEF